MKDNVPQPEKKPGAKRSEASDWLEEVVTLSVLYDFYGELLSTRHRQIFEQYILEDWSLGEIAEAAGLSRQGVYDTVRRCSKKLYEYEEILHLAAKYERRKQQVVKLQETLEQIQEMQDWNALSEVHALSEELLKEF